MGYYFHKSFKVGPARINLSKSGIGWSIGTKGFRFGHRAGHSKSKSNSADKSGIGFFWKLLLLIVVVIAIVFVVSLVIALIKEFWPWLVGSVAVVIAAVVGWNIYQHHKTVKMCSNDQETNEKE